MTVYLFGHFQFESARGSLKRAGEEVRLRPQTAQLLHFLLCNPERLISKAELVEAVWGDSVVNDQAIFQCINQLRKALGEEASNPHYLKTIPRRGYTWISPFKIVEPAEEHPEAEPLPTPTPAPPPQEEPVPLQNVQPVEAKPRRAAPWITLAAVVIATVIAAWFFRPTGAQPIKEEVGGRTRIAFLPFRNTTGDPSLQWVELGLMDMVVRSFGNQPKAGPIPTDRVLKALKDSNVMRGVIIDQTKAERLRDILGAHWLVHVDIQKTGEQFQLFYRAVHRSGRQRTNRLTGDSLSNLATRMTGELSHAFQSVKDLPAHAFSANAFVNETYGLGVAELSKGFEARAIPYFEVCLQKDPTFLWAGYQLVRCHMYRGDDDTAKRLATQYLKLAEQKHDRYLQGTLFKMLGHMVWANDDPEAAGQFYGKALEIWRQEKHHEYISITLVDRSMVLRELGKAKEAEEDLQEALEISKKLDDTYSTAGIYHQLGIAYLDQDKDQEGLAYLDQAQTLFEKVEAQVDTAYVAYDKAIWYYHHNQLDVAMEFCKTGLKASRQAEHLPSSIRTLVLMSEMGIEKEDYNLSQASLQDALPLALATGNPIDEVQVRLSQAKLGALAGRKELLYEAGNRALEIAEQLDDRDFRMEAWSYFGDYYMVQGNAEAGKTYLDLLWKEHLEEASPLAVLLMARYQYLKGEYKQAYEQQLRVKNDWPTIWDSREEKLLATYKNAL